MTCTSTVSAGKLRIEEVDSSLVLPQILRLRATLGRRISLAPDLTTWLDPLDAHATHWGVFRDAELVASARLCVHASAEQMAAGASFASLDPGSCGAVAVISHCVVHPKVRKRPIEAALDAARIERARQLRLGVVLAVAKGARRIAALKAQGFVARDLAPAPDGSRRLVLHLEAPLANVIRMPARSRR